MCLPCLDRTIEHHENEQQGAEGSVSRGNIRCPGCREEAHPPSEFVPLDQIGISKPKKKTYSVSVVMRAEEADGVSLFGQPSLLRTQNQVAISFCNKFSSRLGKEANLMTTLPLVGDA